LLVLGQLLGCLPAYDEREERLSDSMRLEVEGELAISPPEGQRLLDHSHSGANHPGGSRRHRTGIVAKHDVRVEHRGQCVRLACGASAVAARWMMASAGVVE
jgi:hypothetical protein